MGKPKFITLTDKSGISERVNPDWIARYFQSNGGTRVIYGDDSTEWYIQTIGQIDALLGATNGSTRDAAPDLLAALEAAKSWMEEVTDPSGEPYNTICAAIARARGEA